MHQSSCCQKVILTSIPRPCHDAGGRRFALLVAGNVARRCKDGTQPMHNEPAKSAIEDVPDKLPLFFRSLVLPAIAATAGSIAIATGVKERYPKLEKPSFNPTCAVFGPVWTELYTLMSVADYIVAAECSERDGKVNARMIYQIHLRRNALWSILFFCFRWTGMALIEIGAL